jgi:hypothetical protein
MLMLVGHSLDRFLAEPWRSGEAYQNYQFVRGISSTLFLTISGFSFVIASFGHFDDYITWSPRMWARIRRIGLIAFLGYVLNLWASTLTQSIDSLSTANLERFMRFDVLQNIAIGLATLHALLWITRNKHWFGRIVFLAAASVFGLAFVTYKPAVDALMPAPLGAMVNMYHLSRFPVVPYTGFLLLGAGFGYWFWKRKKIGDEWKVFAWASCAAILLISFEIFLRQGVKGGVFPYSAPLQKMPGNTFARAGCALLIISGLYCLGRARIVLSKLSFVLSKDALLVYFIHLLIVFGVSSLPKFAGLEATSMSPFQVACFIAGLALSMAALAAGSGRLRVQQPSLHKLIRHSLILGGALAFTTWPYLTLTRIALSLAISTVIIFTINRFRTRTVRATMDGAA